MFVISRENKDITDLEFANTDVVFRKSCELASKKIEVKTDGRVKNGVKPTENQASKYRNKKGLAYRVRKYDREILKWMF